MTFESLPNPHQIHATDIDWLIPLGFTATILDRLNSKLLRTAGGCLVYTGERDHFSHGRIQKGGRGSGKIGTHRLAWMLAHHQEIPADMQINHHCDNPPCLEPTHLYLGTAADNTADMLKRGRANPASGKRHPRYKISEETIRQLRADYAELGSYTLAARKHGIDPPYAWRIIRGDARPDRSEVR